MFFRQPEPPIKIKKLEQKNKKQSGKSFLNQNLIHKNY
jgi:hypothetical protein